MNTLNKKTFELLIPQPVKEETAYYALAHSVLSSLVLAYTELPYIGNRVFTSKIGFKNSIDQSERT